MAETKTPVACYFNAKMLWKHKRFIKDRNQIDY